MAAEEAWTRIAARLDASHARIRAAVGRSSGTWVGMAATAAGAAFDPLHAWTERDRRRRRHRRRPAHRPELPRRRDAPEAAPDGDEDEVGALDDAGRSGRCPDGAATREVAEVTSRIWTEGPDFQHAVALMHAYQDDSDNSGRASWSSVPIRRRSWSVAPTPRRRAWPTSRARLPAQVRRRAVRRPSGAHPGPRRRSGPRRRAATDRSVPPPGGGRPAPRASAPPPIGTGAPAPPAPGPSVGPRVHPGRHPAARRRAESCSTRCAHARRLRRNSPLAAR